jgi:hypothetical protein
VWTELTGGEGGSAWLVGTGTPSAELGADGDLTSMPRAPTCTRRPRAPGPSSLTSGVPKARRARGSGHPMPWSSVSARHCRRSSKPVVRSVGLVGARGVAPAWPTFVSGPDSCSRTSLGRASSGRSTSGRPDEPKTAAHPTTAGGPARLHCCRFDRGRGLRAQHQRDDGEADPIGSCQVPISTPGRSRTRCARRPTRC